MENKRIYVDTEYMYDGMFYEKRMAREEDKKQIIQIATILFDCKKNEEIASLDILVKPIFHEKLPEFFVELTSINEEMIKEKAIDFILLGILSPSYKSNTSISLSNSDLWV